MGFIGTQQDIDDYYEYLRSEEQYNCRIHHGNEHCDGVGDLEDKDNSCYDCPNLLDY